MWYPIDIFYFYFPFGHVNYGTCIIYFNVILISLNIVGIVLSTMAKYYNFCDENKTYCFVFSSKVYIGMYVAHMLFNSDLFFVSVNWIFKIYNYLSQSDIWIKDALNVTVYLIFFVQQCVISDFYTVLKLRNSSFLF